MYRFTNNCEEGFLICHQQNLSFYFFWYIIDWSILYDLSLVIQIKIKVDG